MPEYVQSIRDMPTPQLMCLRGGFNHHWEPIQKPRKVGQWGRRSYSRCTVCGKGRTKIKNLLDRTAALYYDTPDWHVKVEEPFDAFDVSEELDRRLNRKTTTKTRRGLLRAV